MVNSVCQVSKFVFHLFHLGGNTWNSNTIPYLRTQREQNGIGHKNSSSSNWSWMIEKRKLCIMFQRLQCIILKHAKIRLMLAVAALHLNTSEVNERAFPHLQFPYSSHHIHQVGQSILLLSHKSWCNKDRTRAGTLDGIRIRTNISTKVCHKGMTIIFWRGGKGDISKSKFPHSKNCWKNYERGTIGKNLYSGPILEYNKKLLHKLLPRGKNRAQPEGEKTA